MRACKILFALVLVTLILSPVSFDRGPAGPGTGALPWVESMAASGKTVAERAAGQGDPDTAGVEDGSLSSHLTPQEVRQLLTIHNHARARVGVAPLVWSDILATYAQEWADHLASTSRRMEHRPHSGTWKQEHGENLFMGTAGYYGAADAAAAWERERSAYDGRTIDGSSLYAFGHYTQLVWRNTKRIGCAKVECAGNVIIICNYDPPGNVLGQTPY